MDFINLVAMTSTIPTAAYDGSMSVALMALVAVVFALGGLAAADVARGRMEAFSRRRRAAHLRIVQRPVFGAAH